MIKNLLLLFIPVTFIIGCATTPKDYSKFNAANPHSILIVPVVNDSVDVDAPDYFLSTISRPVAEQGYYVFPVNMVKRILEDAGLSDANLVHDAPTEKLCSLFGSDAVLYIKINSWDAKYLLISTTVTVALEYTIKDGKTGEILWEDKRIVKYTPQRSGSSGNWIADLITDVAIAAVEKANPSYIPLAQRANAEAFKYPGPGIPPGIYALSKEKNKK
jgi:hypothetical protein